MKRRLFAATAIVFGLALGFAAMSPAQEEGGAPPGMEAYMALAAPGEHHEHLGHGIGKWNYDIKIWMAPGAPPTESSGTVEANWILGGRFVETVFTGEPIMGMDTPFEGRGIDGYDNGQKKYIGTWMDNFGTMMMSFEGTCESDGKVRTLTAEFIEPTSGATMKNRGVTTMISDTSYKYESYMIMPDGNEFKNMELVATKK